MERVNHICHFTAHGQEPCSPKIILTYLNVFCVVTGWWTVAGWRCNRAKLFRSFLLAETSFDALMPSFIQSGLGLSSSSSRQTSTHNAFHINSQLCTPGIQSARITNYVTTVWARSPLCTRFKLWFCLVRLRHIQWIFTAVICNLASSFIN